MGYGIGSGLGAMGVMHMFGAIGVTVWFDDSQTTSIPKAVTPMCGRLRGLALRTQGAGPNPKRVMWTRANLSEIRPARGARGRGDPATLTIHMRSSRALLSALSLVLCCLASVGSARAYVQRRSDTGIPLVWPARNMSLVGYSNGISTMTFEQIRDAMTQSVSPWTKSDPAVAAKMCTDLTMSLQVLGVDQVPPGAIRDNKNIIAIRGDTWEHDPGALALTSVFYLNKTGKIVEADLEANAVDFRWGDVTTDSRPQLQDLQNALTHEMGHFIGLDHPCYLVVPKVDNETDQHGARVPYCGDGASVTDVIRDATMYPSADSGDTSKRSLSPDDQQAVCDLYPLQPAIASDGGCACVVAPRAAGTGGVDAAAISLAALGLWIARTRRGPQARRAKRNSEASHHRS